MNVVTLDFETFWSQDHSLSKMLPSVYVMHPDTQIISCSVKVNDGASECFFGEGDVLHRLSKIDWATSMALGHNMSGFDCMLLAWRLGIRPRMWGCTMAMARPFHRYDGLGLAALVKRYGIGAKDNTALLATKGKRLEDFTPAERRGMAVYNNADADQCYDLFKILRPATPAREMWLIDSTIRMLAEPQFELDRVLCVEALKRERAAKIKSLDKLAAKLGVDTVDEMRDTVMSAAKFSALLDNLGVDVPMKESPKKPGTLIPALAKTDEAFLALMEHDDPLVAAAARTRLGAKSTLLETRLEAFISVGDATNGMLPVPVKYAGAHTYRDSGEQYNCFTGDVEVLTRNGWVRFDRWGGDAIMQWWPDGRATFEESPGALRKHYSGHMVDVQAVLLDACMTPEHRIVSVRGVKPVERPAQFLLDHTGLGGIPTSGAWVGASESVYTPDEARLMAAIAADGCTILRKTTRPGMQIGLRKLRKIERMRNLLDAVGVPYTIREYPPQTGHKGAHNTVQFYIPDCPYPKGFGPWVLGLDRAALDALVEEIPYWDGWRHHKTGSHEFCAADAAQAEWVATAWHLSDTPATVRHYNGRWQLHRRRQGSRTSVTATDVKRVQHDGDVFCASVESSYIFIRRNGKIAVTGQCQNLPRIGRDKHGAIVPKRTNALRMSMRAPRGKRVIVADQSGIELRVNHFLWKVEDSMALYKASPGKADLYRAFAASLYNKEPDDVTKPERQMGKVCVLEGTLVLTDQGEVPIEHVTPSHKVWDGIEWVSTMGAIFKGVKDVITYDGLSATPDHEVWVEDGRKVPFGAAAAQSLRLARTGAGRTPLGFGGVGVAGDSPDQRLPLRAGAVRGLQHDQTQGRVWDLLNCGPRSRFTANGRLVSNCQLGLGFSAGWRTFMRVAKTMGGVDISEEEAQSTVYAWRDHYYRIVNGWGQCQNALEYIMAGESIAIDPWGLLHTEPGGIRLPSGRLIRYPNLRNVRNEDTGRNEMVYADGRHTTYIYGGRVTENVVQALACDSIMDCSIEYFKRTGLRPALRVHDELVYVVDEAAAEGLLDELQDVMRTPPKWWPDLIVWSEGSAALTYGDAK